MMVSNKYLTSVLFLKVSWYRIFGCVAAGSNTKVRLNNHHLPNAGEEVRETYVCHTPSLKGSLY